MSADEQKALMRRYYEEVWQRGNMSVGDQLVSPNLVDHMPLPGQTSGRAGHHQAVQMIRTAFPDLQFQIHHVVVDGDIIVGHWTMQATHQGELLGVPPTGKSVTISGIDLGRWENGQLAEIWHVEELLTMLQQIGAVPGPQ